MREMHGIWVEMRAAFIPTMIPRIIIIPTLVSRIPIIPTLIPCIPTLIPCIPHHSPHSIPRFPIRLLQIAVMALSNAFNSVKGINRLRKEKKIGY